MNNGMRVTVDVYFLILLLISVIKFVIVVHYQSIIVYIVEMH